MSENKSLQDSLRALIQTLFADDQIADEADRVMRQVILPALTAKMIIDNLGDALNGINDSNEELMGFRINEVDLYKALYRLLPKKIHDLEDSSNETSSFNEPTNIS